RCDTITGLRCYAFAPPSPQVPAMGSRLARWTYNTTFEGTWQVTMKVLLYVNPSDLARAQQALDSYCSPTGAQSVPSALQEVVVTPGVIESVRVVGGAQPYILTGDQSAAHTLVGVLEVE